MDIQELVNHPQERLAVELKNWIDPDSPAGIATLVKAAIAMRNNNGGYPSSPYFEKGNNIFNNVANSN